LRIDLEQPQKTRHHHYLALHFDLQQHRPQKPFDKSRVQRRIGRITVEDGPKVFYRLGQRAAGKETVDNDGKE
jgi:hypothetical protein